jgi:hypothetical protein
MSEQEKEMAGEYEIIQSCIVGHKRFVIGRCDGKSDPYMVANHREKMDGMFSEYYDAGVSADYMEILGAYIQRQQDEYAVLMQQRAMRGSDGVPFTAEDCLPSFNEQNITHQIVVMDAKYLKPEFGIKEEQLFYPMSGFGCEPKGRGGKVFGRDCYTGEKYYVRREHIAGVLKPDRVPQWAADNVRAFQKAEKIQAQLANRREER